MPALLVLFLLLRLAQQVVETALARLNRRHALDPGRLAEAGRALDIGEGEMAKAHAAGFNDFAKIEKDQDFMSLVADPRYAAMHPEGHR